MRSRPANAKRAKPYPASAFRVTDTTVVTTAIARLFAKARARSRRAKSS